MIFRQGGIELFTKAGRANANNFLPAPYFPYRFLSGALVDGQQPEVPAGTEIIHPALCGYDYRNGHDDGGDPLESDHSSS